MIFKNPYPGILFCGSGIDFCGKSIQVVRMHNWLRAYLKDKKIEVISTKQPTNYHFGKRIRAILGDKEIFAQTDQFDLQELFAKDSRMHCEKDIVPYLRAGNVICTDRFRESMVYGPERGNLVEVHMLLEMNYQYHGENYWVWPDKIFVFDLPPELALERGKSSGRRFDEMEKLETLIRVRENFHAFAKEYPNANLTFIDASRDVEVIFQDVRKAMESILVAKGFKLDS